MHPFEVRPRDACPMLAAIGGFPGGGLEAGSIQERGIAGIDGHVIDMLIAAQHLLPILAAIV